MALSGVVLAEVGAVMQAQDVSQEPSIWVHGQECKCSSKGEHYTTYMCNGIPLMQRRMPSGRVEWEAGYSDEWVLEWQRPGKTKPCSPEAALRDLRARLITRRYGIDRQLERLAGVGVGALGGVSVHEVNVSACEINVIAPEVNALFRSNGPSTWATQPPKAIARTTEGETVCGAG